MLSTLDVYYCCQEDVGVGCTGGLVCAGIVERAVFDEFSGEGRRSWYFPLSL